MAKKKFDEDYQTSLKIHNALHGISRIALPFSPGKGVYDKALMGRIVSKATLNKAEREVAGDLPEHTGDKKYYVQRALTNPVVAGVLAGAAAAGLSAAKPAFMKSILTAYKEHPDIKPLANFARKKLLHPSEDRIISSAEELGKIYKPSADRLARKLLTGGIVGATATAMGRQLHARALMGEIIKEHRAVHQKDPSQYIRTKLRDDVLLKEQSKLGEAMDKTALTLIEGVSKVMMQKLSMDAAGIMEGGKSLGLKALSFMKEQGANAVGGGAVKALKEQGLVGGTQVANRMQLKGMAVVGGTAAAAGLGAKAMLGKKKNDTKS